MGTHERFRHTRLHATVVYMRGSSRVRDGDCAYLEGHRVNAGDELDLATLDSGWVTVIVRGVSRRSVELLWLVLASPIELSLPLPSPARFRWPPVAYLRCKAPRRVD